MIAWTDMVPFTVPGGDLACSFPLSLMGSFSQHRSRVHSRTQHGAGCANCPSSTSRSCSAPLPSGRHDPGTRTLQTRLLGFFPKTSSRPCRPLQWSGAGGSLVLQSAEWVRGSRRSLGCFLKSRFRARSLLAPVSPCASPQPRGSTLNPADPHHGLPAPPQALSMARTILLRRRSHPPGQGEGTWWSCTAVPAPAQPWRGGVGYCHPLQTAFFFLFFFCTNMFVAQQRSPGERNRLLCNGPRCFRRSAAAAPRPASGPAAVGLWGGAGWDRAPLSPQQLRLFLWSGPRGQDGVKSGPAPHRDPLLPCLHHQPMQHPTAPAPSMRHRHPAWATSIWHAPPAPSVGHQHRHGPSTPSVGSPALAWAISTQRGPPVPRPGNGGTHLRRPLGA